MDCAHCRSLMDCYPGTDTDSMESVFDYSDITTLTNFDNPVHDIRMKENMKMAKILPIKCRFYFKRQKTKYGPEQIRCFIKGVLLPVTAKRCNRLILHGTWILDLQA